MQYNLAYIRAVGQVELLDMSDINEIKDKPVGQSRNQFRLNNVTCMASFQCINKETFIHNLKE